MRRREGVFPWKSPASTSTSGKAVTPPSRRTCDAPAEALSELDGLVAEMMDARGLPLQEEPGEDTTEPETVRQFAEARRVTRLVDAGESYDPGDVANAVDAYRSLFDYLLNLGPTSGAPA